MNIFVITGSPRPTGNSNTLAAEFIRGAEEAGHQVARFDAAQKNVHPCMACESCGTEGPCVFDDDFAEARAGVLAADMVVFATPMYYFGISAQLKAVIDRFFAINSLLLRTPKKAVLLMTCAGNITQTKDFPLRTHYDAIVQYLGWTDAGCVIASGVHPVGAVADTTFARQAYELGKSL